MACILFPNLLWGQDSLKVVYLEEVSIAFDTISSENYLLSVDQYMQQRNDLQLIKRGNFAFEPIVEGFTDGQITVAIDGMRVFGACTDKMDPATSYLEPVNLRKLSVLKDNESQMYGTSLGGTITAEMKYPDINNHLKVGAQTAYSSNTNGFDGNLFVEKGINDKWGFRYSSAYRKHGSYTDGHNDLVKYTQFEKLNQTITSRYKASDHDEFTFLMMYDHGKDIGYPALNMDVSSAMALMGNIGYKRHFERKYLHHLEAKVYYNEINHVMDDTKRENVAMHMDMPGKSKTFGAWSSLHWDFKNRKTTLKGDFYSNHLFADMTMYSPTGGVNMYMLTWGDIKRNSLALSFNDQWKIDTRFTLITNARIEIGSTELQNQTAVKQFETLNYFINEPRSEISGVISTLFKYDLTDKLSSNFGVSYISRMPSASELYGFYLFNANDQFDYIGSPDLKNENVIAFDLSLEYTADIWGIGARGKASFINDYIVGVVDEDYDPMTPGALGVKRYQNIDNANSNHLELFGYLQVNKSLEYNLRLVSENGYIDALHSAMPYQRPFTIKQKVNYQLKKMTTSLYYEYCIGMQSPSSVLGEQKTDAYHLVNMNFSYPLKTEKLAMFFDLGIENLLNTYYVDPFAWNAIPNMGRNMKASIRIII